MPVLFLILILMAVHMIFLDGGSTGLRYLFAADFSKITSKVVLQAMGLSFFTLSAGMGILVTYGGYMPKDQKVTSTSVQMIVLYRLGFQWPPTATDYVHRFVDTIVGFDFFNV